MLLYAQDRQQTSSGPASGVAELRGDRETRRD